MDRLSAVRRATRVRKQEHDAQHLDALMRELARMPRLRNFAQRVLAHPRSFALNVSNVPGPPVPLYMCGGKIVGVFPSSIILEGMGLNVTVFSYMEVRMVQSSGKNLSSRALVKYDTPPVPPVPRL